MLKISPRVPQGALGDHSKWLRVPPKSAKGVPRTRQRIPRSLQKRSKKRSKTTPGDFSKNDRLQVAKTPLFTMFLKGRFSKTPLFTTFSWVRKPLFFQKWRKHHYLLCFKHTHGTCLSMGTGSAFKRRDVVQTFLEGAAQICIIFYSTLFCSTALYSVVLDSITVYFASLTYSSTVLFSFSLLPLLYCSTLLFAFIPLLIHSSTALF